MEISRPGAAKRILIQDGGRNLTLYLIRGKDGRASNILFDTWLCAVRKIEARPASSIDRPEPRCYDIVSRNDLEVAAQRLGEFTGRLFYGERRHPISLEVAHPGRLERAACGSEVVLPQSAILVTD